MPTIAYIEKKFQAKTLAVIQDANEIIDEYRAQGYDLTLRQLYYQFVARGLIANKQTEYNRLGEIIADARMAGYIDWLAIEDRTRNIKRQSHWSDPGDMMASARASFRLDHWEGQEHRLEVWIEKEALVGVIAGICNQLDVPYYACRGYVSLSEMWRAARRFRASGVDTTIVHLGDHDPSGVDMTRDIDDRERIFGARVTVERIALNMDQVEQYGPPPNPAKISDSRSPEYIANYGNDSWELDALEPSVMRDLIDEKVREYRDEDKYQAVLAQEQKYIDILKHIELHWEDLDPDAPHDRRWDDEHEEDEDA